MKISRSKVLDTLKKVRKLKIGIVFNIRKLVKTLNSTDLEILNKLPSDTKVLYLLNTDFKTYVAIGLGHRSPNDILGLVRKIKKYKIPNYVIVKEIQNIISKNKARRYNG